LISQLVKEFKDKNELLVLLKTAKLQTVAILFEKLYTAEPANLIYKNIHEATKHLLSPVKIPLIDELKTVFTL
jgi:hypothetical protein